MSEVSRQQSRESPTDRGLVDYQAVESSDHATGPNTIVLGSQSSGRINYAAGKQSREEELRPYSDGGSRLLTQSNYVEDSGYDYENETYEARRAREIRSNLLLRHVGGYGSRPTIPMQPDNRPSDHESRPTIPMQADNRPSDHGTRPTIPMQPDNGQFDHGSRSSVRVQPDTGPCDHGSRSSVRMQPENRPLDRGSYAPDYRGPDSMDTNRRFGPNPIDPSRGLRPQGYCSERQDHPFLGQNNGYQELPSRPPYQYPTPSYYIGGQPVFDDSHRHHGYGALEEPYPPARYPVQQTRYIANDFSPEHYFDGYGQYSQGPQGPNSFPEEALPPFPPDIELSYPAPEAPSSEAKFNKLCNNHHLRGYCLLQDACRYVHGTINQDQLQRLKNIAKRTPCKLRLNCNDRFCYAGHKCPYRPCSGKCPFPAELHYDGPEYVPGRLAKRVEGNQEKHPKKKQSKHRSGRLQGQPSKKEPRSSRENIGRAVDALLNEIAPRGDRPPKSPRIMGSPPRKTTEREMSPLEGDRARRHQGSQRSTPPGRRADIPRYDPPNGRRVSTLGEYRVEKKSGENHDDAGSLGRARRQRRRGRRSRVTSTHSQRPMEEAIL